MTDTRHDLILTAYAVHLGFDVKAHHDLKITGPSLFDENGIPFDSLQFVLGDMHVWQTARGWRVSKLTVHGTYEKPTESDFFVKLLEALEEGNRRWRDR